MPRFAAGPRSWRAAFAAGLAVVAVLTAGAGAPARAAEVSMEGGVLRYAAASQERNDLLIESGDLPGTVQVSDDGEAADGSDLVLEAGPGCREVVNRVYCGGLDAAPDAAEVRLDDRDDEADVEAPLVAMVDGGLGMDVISGSERDDVLDGGAGPDVVHGEAGDDSIAAAQDGADDQIRCGTGEADAATADPGDLVDPDCEQVEVVLPPPEPTPSPSPDPGPSPSPSPDPGEPEDPEPTPEPGSRSPQDPPRDDGEAAPAPTPPSRGDQMRLLVPRPVVRIAGRLTRRGARVRVLEVTAPAGSRVTVSCTGRKCPARRDVVAVKGSRSGAVRTVRLRRFQRPLAAGTVLTIAVTRPGSIGKRTRFEIRRGKAPRRSDGCVTPGLLLIRCPT